MGIKKTRNVRMTQLLRESREMEGSFTEMGENDVKAFE